MKKKFWFIIVFILIISVLMLSIYSKEKFDSYNFIKSFYGCSIVSKRNPTYNINKNLVIVYLNYKSDYINKLIHDYKKDGWVLKTSDAGMYILSKLKQNIKVEVTTNSFLSRNYALVRKENLYEK